MLWDVPLWKGQHAFLKLRWAVYLLLSLAFRDQGHMKFGTSFPLNSQSCELWCFLEFSFHFHCSKELDLRENINSPSEKNKWCGLWKPSGTPKEAITSKECLFTLVLMWLHIQFVFWFILQMGMVFADSTVWLS